MNSKIITMSSECGQDEGYAWVVLAGHLTYVTYVSFLGWITSYVAPLSWIDPSLKNPENVFVNITENYSSQNYTNGALQEFTAQDFLNSQNNSIPGAKFNDHYFENVGPGEIGHLYAISSIAGTVGSMMAGYFLRTFQSIPTMILSSLTIAAGGFLSSFITNNFYLMILAQTIVGLGVGVANVVSLMTLNQWFHKRRSTANAMTGMARPLGGLLGSILYRVLSENFGLNWMEIFMVSYGLGVVLIPASLIHRRFIRKIDMSELVEDGSVDKRKEVLLISEKLKSPSRKSHFSRNSQVSLTSGDEIQDDQFYTSNVSLNQVSVLNSHITLATNEQKSLKPNDSNDSLKSPAKHCSPLKQVLKNYKFWVAVTAQALVASSMRIINKNLPMIFSQENVSDKQSIQLCEIYQITLTAAKTILGFGCSFCKTSNQEIIYITSGCITFAGFLMLTLLPMSKLVGVQMALVVIGVGCGTSGGSWITLLVNNIGKENITAAISVYTPLINVLMSLNLSIFGELQEFIQKSALMLPTTYILLAVLSITYLLVARKHKESV